MSTEAGVDLQNVGDIDGDGDDELLVLMEGFSADGQVVRIIDAEPTSEGRFQVVGLSFDLPLPDSLPEESDDFDLGYVQARVGDYNGDGFKDVALVRTVHTSDFWGEVTGIWLTTPPSGAVPTSPPTPPGDLSYCELPPPTPPAETEPEEEPKAGACSGCAAVPPTSALLLLALPWRVRRALSRS